MRMNRRRFLKTTLTATAFPNLIPASALGRDGAVAPSGRITMGFIGHGGRASQVVPVYLDQPDVQGLAVCDVDGRNRAPAGKRELCFAAWSRAAHAQ